MQPAMRRSPLAILFAIVLLDLLGFGIVIPFMGYTVESFGASAGVVGLLVSTFSVAQFVCAPLWGRLSDRIGRRPILLLGLAGSAAGWALFGAASSLWMLFLGRIVAGVFGATVSTAQAYIADSTTPENRAKGMGLIGAAFGLGFILGPALGGLLAPLGGPLAGLLDGTPLRFLGAVLRHHPYALPCLGASLLSALALLAALFLLPESLSAEVRAEAAGKQRAGRLAALREALRQPVLAQLATTFFLYYVGYAMMEATLTLLVERRLGGDDALSHALLLRRVGWLFAAIGLVGTVVQGFLLGPLFKRFGERALLFVGLGCGIASLGLFPLWRGWPGFFAGAVVLSVSSALVNPAITSLLSKGVGREKQGQTMGLVQSAGSLARMLGPALGGLLFQRASVGAPFVAGAALVAAALLVVSRRQGAADAQGHRSVV
jgi:MFS family permease